MLLSVSNFLILDSKSNSLFSSSICFSVSIDNNDSNPLSLIFRGCEKKKSNLPYFLGEKSRCRSTGNRPILEKDIHIFHFIQAIFLNQSL